MTTLDQAPSQRPTAPTDFRFSPRRGEAGPLQFVTPDGDITQEGHAYGIDLDLSRRLYRDMILARRLDHEALALQRQGELGLWLMSWGQEAAQVGSVRALRDTDTIFPTYREHAAALCRGITPAELLIQWRGAAHSGWDPRAHHFHIYSLVLGTQTLHATGFAKGAALEESDEVVTVYFGDGAASQGDVNEAFNWAAAGNLPVLFFCQNNQWAISTPASVQMKTPIHRRAEGFGLDAFHVDGNDVLAVHAVTRQAAERVRSGEGPALIEAMTYRRAGHSSSDDPDRYRSGAEGDYWEARDPISRIEKLLRAHRVPESFFTDLESESSAFGEAVRRACHSLPEPLLASVFQTTYADPHPVVERQLDEHRTFRASLGEH